MVKCAFLAMDLAEQERMKILGDLNIPIGIVESCQRTDELANLKKVYDAADCQSRRPIGRTGNANQLL